MRALLAALVVLLWTHAAVAQDSGAAATALFDQARDLMAQGKYEEACPKLAEAQRLRPGIGTLYNLSECYEHIGRTASAWNGYREVASLARAEGQAEREEAARAKAAEVERKLTKLRINVAAPVDGLSVERNGAAVTQPLWGTALPVDPGEQHIVAKAPGKRTWDTRVSAEGVGKTVDVQIPALEDGPAGPDPVVDNPDVTPAPVPPEPGTPEGESARPWQAPLGIGLFVSGAVVALAGGGVAIGAKVIADGADCDEANNCSQQGVDDRATAITMGNAATGLLIGGGVIAASGLAVWLTAPDDEPSASAVQAVRLSFGPGSALISGRW